MDTPEVSEEVKTLLLLNEDYQDQLRQAKQDISGLVGQMTQLTLAVNAMTDKQMKGKPTIAVQADTPVTGATAVVSGPTQAVLEGTQPSTSSTWPQWSLPHPGVGTIPIQVYRGPITATSSSTSQVSAGVPAGLGVAKPLWSSGAANYQQHINPPVVPPHNPAAGPGGWMGWGNLQSTPGQVGVSLVPPTLLPHSLLHQDWFETRTTESKGKRSKHWMRPDFLFHQRSVTMSYHTES